MLRQVVLIVVGVVVAGSSPRRARLRVPRSHRPRGRHPVRRFAARHRRISRRRPLAPRRGHIARAPDRPARRRARQALARGGRGALRSAAARPGARGSRVPRARDRRHAARGVGPRAAPAEEVKRPPRADRVVIRDAVLGFAPSAFAPGLGRVQVRIEGGGGRPDGVPHRCPGYPAARAARLVRAAGRLASPCASSTGRASSRPRAASSARPREAAGLAAGPRGDGRRQGRNPAPGRLPAARSPSASWRAAPASGCGRSCREALQRGRRRDEHGHPGTGPRACRSGAYGGSPGSRS